MDRFIALIQFLDLLRQRKKHDEIAFLAVNEAYKVVPYDLAVFWEYDFERIAFKKVSGNNTLDPKGPFSQKLKALIKESTPTPDSFEAEQSKTIIKTIEFSDNTIADFTLYGAIVFFADDDLKPAGGLYFQREGRAFNEGEKTLLEEIGKAFVYSYQSHKPPPRAVTGVLRWNRFRWLVSGLALLLCFFPIRLSVTAPAEIVAKNPFAITAPFDGTIAAVNVNPSSKVQEGDILIEMDSNALETEYKLAKKRLEAAQTGLSSARYGILNRAETKERVARFEAEIERFQIEAEYKEYLLERQKIKAPKSGVAIFSDVNALAGKPVKTGDQLMMIANTLDKELLIRVPSQALIPIDTQSMATFYLNVAPLDRHEAKVDIIGYQASADPDGLLTYKIRANIPKDHDFRVGLKGQATIYSGFVPVIYAVMRRPLIALRRITGI